MTEEGLKSIYKNFNESGESLVKRLQAFREHGVHVLGSFIFGLPGDRPDSFDATLKVAEEAGHHVRAVRDADAVSRARSTSRRGRNRSATNPERIGGIPINRHWLIPQAQRPKIYMAHPVMSADADPQTDAGGVGPVSTACRSIWERAHRRRAYRSSRAWRSC